jgi:hypothetical protein
MVNGQQKDADHYEIIGKTPTRGGAGTFFWSPELDRYYVAAPTNDQQEAAILVYAPLATKRNSEAWNKLIKELDTLKSAPIVGNPVSAGPPGRFAAIDFNLSLLSYLALKIVTVGTDRHRTEHLRAGLAHFTQQTDVSSRASVSYGVR